MKQWHEQFGQQKWILEINDRQIMSLRYDGRRFVMSAVIGDIRVAHLQSLSVRKAKIEAEEIYAQLLEMEIQECKKRIRQYEAQLGEIGVD